jgi:hypothetical protein
VLVTGEGMMTASIHPAKTFLRKDCRANQAARHSLNGFAQLAWSPVFAPYTSSA